ncbi:MAG: hypothetical protein WAV21_01710 [Minisyncoccia bacterium]
MMAPDWESLAPPNGPSRKKKLLWVSQHLLSRVQRRALRDIFGDYEIKSDPKPFEGARDIAARFRAGKFDEMIIVAPLTVLMALMREGIFPWIAVQDYSSGKGRFRDFERVKKIEITTEKN